MPRMGWLAATAALLLGAVTGCEAPVVVGGPSPDGAESEMRAAPIYGYVNAQGRAVFVDDLSKLPAEHREEAREVDLSHVSLNLELGAELDAAVDRELARLSGSEPCREARAEAREPGWRQTWERHGHLIGIGAIALLLVLTAPWVMRRVDPPQWGRVLTLVLPVLLLLAIVTHTVQRASETIRETRELADLCDGQGDDPAATASPLARVHALRERIERRERERSLWATDPPE